MDVGCVLRRNVTMVKLYAVWLWEIHTVVAVGKCGECSKVSIFF